MLAHAKGVARFLQLRSVMRWETDERPDPALDDERRRYYRLTALGHRVGAAEQARLAALLSAAQLRQLGLNGLT